MLNADQTLLRLADPSARDAMLKSAGLLAIAATCYAIDPATVVGETTAAYDRIDLTVTVSPSIDAAGHWGRSSYPLMVEGLASVTGLVAPGRGADAIWADSILVRTAGGNGTIYTVTLTGNGLAR
jgi:hypothetical protein